MIVKILTYLFSFICIQLFSSWIVGFVWHVVTGMPPAEALKMALNPSQAGINAPLLIVQTVVYGIITMIVFIRFKWSVVSPRYLRSRRWSVFFWCFVAALGTIIPMLWLQDLMPALPDTTRSAFTAIINTEFGYTAMCIFAPLVEELVFRGAVLRSLLRSPLHPVYGILISAVLFALVHINPAQMPHAFIIGLLLGWMYYRTGSILPGVAFHWANNTVVFVVCRVAPYMQDMSLLEIFKGSQRSVILAIVFSLLIFIPALLQLNILMKKADERR